MTTTTGTGTPVAPSRPARRPKGSVADATDCADTDAVTHPEQADHCDRQSSRAWPTDGDGAADLVIGARPPDERREALSQALDTDTLSPGGIEINYRLGNHHGHDRYGPPSRCLRANPWMVGARTRRVATKERRR